MRIILIATLCLLNLAHADFDPLTVIHPVVQKLSLPQNRPEFSVPSIAVSTKSKAASGHVIQGIAHLNASWDFEAYRHFCEAVKADPDCLMAYWGISMSLAGRNHEFFKERKIAINRMLDLVEADAGVDLEKGYAEAAGRLFANGARAAGQTYLAISEKYPNDRQSKLLGLFLTRDGFDEFGTPRPGQKKCWDGLLEMVKEDGDSIPVVAFWVASQAEAPGDGWLLAKDVLPFARKLARLNPDFPPFQLTAAHLEARSGNAKRAIGYCLQAINLYEVYMEKDKISKFDCDGWVRAKVYLASLHASKGEFEQATKVSKELASLEVSEDRIYSRGASLILWEARTLGGRLALMRETSADLDAGLKQLDAVKKEGWFHKKSLSYTYRDCLAFALGVRKALAVNNLSAARGLHRSFTERGKIFEQGLDLARNTSSISEWLRAKGAIVILEAELLGLIHMQEAGASKLAALNFFKAAADRQSNALNFLPPVLNYPMELRIGTYYLESGDSENAAEALREGYNRMPNHIQILRAYRTALVKLGKIETAAKVAQQIEGVKK